MLKDIDYDVKRANLYEVIAQKIEEGIMSDVSQVGQRLPSEQSLAENFGVSRNVIRESLKLLKERSLITLRTGDGSYIAKPDPQSLINVINRYVQMESMSSDNIYELRRALEVAVCAKAAECVTDEQIERLYAMTDALLDEGLTTEQYAQQDIQFHIELARITNNPMMTLFVEVMSTLLTDIMSIGFILMQPNYAAVLPHRRIVDALAAHDPAQAKQAMRDHLQQSLRNVDLYCTMKQKEKEKEEQQDDI